MLAVAELIDMSMMPAREYQDCFAGWTVRNPLQFSGLLRFGARHQT